jgi:hypothetical protein
MARIRLTPKSKRTRAVRDLIRLVKDSIRLAKDLIMVVVVVVDFNLNSSLTENPILFLSVVVVVIIVKKKRYIFRIEIFPFYKYMV